MVRVTGCDADDVPTFWLAKVRLVWESVTAGRPMPVPLTGTVCWPAPALSLMVMVADRVPTAVGPLLKRATRS